MIKNTIHEEYAKSTKLVDMLEGTGFARGEGAYYVREHKDGRTQRLRLVWWSNPELARMIDMPVAHLGVGVQIEGTAEAFYKIALVEEDETLRDWDEVAQEFHETFMQMLDSPLEDGRLMQWKLEDMYLY